ncbi:MAG: arginine decarboxylase [Bacteroidetes bacterium]|jgi:arginine decarboxylase|nr:arginine decarboxylase [Bacteroidota bacterium]
MKTKYIDLIDQTYFFPQEEFTLRDDNLLFHGIDLMQLVEQYGSPLKFMYLPKISENISKAKQWFADAFRKYDYHGAYHYCYCTKSSHFRHVIERALDTGVYIETSSASDLSIVNVLLNEKKVKPTDWVICNGFKQQEYVDKIAELMTSKAVNVLPVLDNYVEIEQLKSKTSEPFSVGIRIASEEEPKFEFYTSRLGIGYRNIVPFYKQYIQDDPQISLRMLHFFINTGIRDTAYYWNELQKCLKVYVGLKKICPTLNSLNIGGGFPIKNSLAFSYDYAYMIDEIVNQVRIVCEEAGIEVPDLYTEFGSYTVGESAGTIYKVLYQKQQNDREKWNMIDSSFITTMPDSWAINKRFIMLPLNRWNDTYERVLLGGITCDSDDYYNSEQHVNAIYLPRFSKSYPLYIGFFHTGAYQETVGGFGGLQHCLVPQPKYVLLDRDEEGNLTSKLFKEQQTALEFLTQLGYTQ